MKQAKIATIIGIIVIALAGYLYYSGTVAFQGAGSNAARVATSSTIGVGPQLNKTLFTNNVGGLCASRIISSVASPLMLSFHSAVTPTGVIGHLQAASTSIVYDSALYGCGGVTAYAFSSTTITISQTSQ